MKKGERIRTRREQLGLTQTALADLIGESKQTLYKYEGGIITNIPSDKIESIAEVLKVSPSWIMGWTDDPTVGTMPPTSIPMSPPLQTLADALDQLNDEGQEKLLDYAADLVASGRYIKTDPSGVDQKKA